MPTGNHNNESKIQILRIQLKKYTLNLYISFFLVNSNTYYNTHKNSNNNIFKTSKMSM